MGQKNYSGTEYVLCKLVGDCLTRINAFEAGRLLLPELDRSLRNRFRMLKTIQVSGPIGRRTLAEVLNRTEREIRNETVVLQEMQLIQILHNGMKITDLGYEVLEQLKDYFYEASGIADKEKQLATRLHINQVVIVPGNIEQEPASQAFLGKEAINLLSELATPNSIVAVTGGSSVASLRNYLVPSKPFNSMKFVAARGSIGDEMVFQANTLVAKFAKASDGTYRTLFLPEHLSEQAYVAMMQEPIVKETVALYDKVNIVLHGIGSAEEMVIRRKMPEQERSELLKNGAIGEAFGYYFNEQGEVVHHIKTIGIQLDQVHQSNTIVAIAGGLQKAKAIEAYFKNAARHTVLITDENFS